VTILRGPTGFAALEQPRAWPPTRGRSRPEQLQEPLDTLPGVGPAVKRKLARLGLETVADLLEHVPFRYVPVRKVAELHGETEEVAIRVRVARASSRRVRPRLTVINAVVGDETGEIAATWWNQQWLADKLVAGIEVQLVGTHRHGTFAVRETDFHGSNAARVPVYRASEALTPKKVRDLVTAALRHVRDFPDPLPAELKTRERLPLYGDALEAMHRSESDAVAEEGRRRLAFDELLLLQLGIARRARLRERSLAPSLGEPGELALRYRRALPFALTPHQEQVIREIDADLARAVPMQRLLQGDVGSGKTAVALYALLRGVENGRQAALMAPTETLAEQHFLTIEGLCSELGVDCVLLTSALPAKQHATIRQRLRAGDAQIAVGTHALIQQDVDFADLAVAVVDEQHRFGVEQRKALAEGRSPHVLHMTATPIPRTLALTVYGDLAVSEIAQPPASRKPVITSAISDERASEAYTRLTRLLREGRQAYVVCPLVEVSETTRARAAEEEAARLQRGELRNFRVGCIHGRLKPAARRELMARFTAGELDVLVATTVIEVGVDVPNATVMIVQEADRFGLAQLHQLRGRVGRGAEQSYCLLVSRAKEELTDDARERLDAMVATTSGFELAEKDLELRKSGQLLGTRQSGLSDLRFANVLRDRPLLERARSLAPELRDEGPLSDAVDKLFGDVEPEGLA
jgi:ATP-dependent DNA helicase RecG